MAIRSICFMEEHGVKAKQVFDGNDFQATHVITYDEDEPIGTIRVRWFKDFANLERASFRPDYRDFHVIRNASEFVFDHIARKGYDRVLTHAAPAYAMLWRRKFGFKIVPDKARVEFDGHPESYVELVKELSPPPNAITNATDPTVLFRIEGNWDQPSIYEKRP